MTELCDIFYRYKSDKCPKVFHSYSDKYYELLKHGKTTFNYVLEIGVGTPEIMNPISGPNYQIGSSLRSWRDFFTKAFVFGLDIDQRVLFEDDRLKCFHCDQSNQASLIQTVQTINNYIGSKIEYDLIVDDGSHNINHMVLSFNTLKNYLKTNGIYIIEDIKLKDLKFFESLACENFKLIYSHPGSFEWDSFVAFIKIN